MAMLQRRFKGEPDCTQRDITLPVEGRVNMYDYREFDNFPVTTVESQQLGKLYTNIRIKIPTSITFYAKVIIKWIASLVVLLWFYTIFVALLSRYSM